MDTFDNRLRIDKYISRGTDTNWLKSLSHLMLCVWPTSRRALGILNSELLIVDC